MEGDIIRVSGEHTAIDLWLAGQSRAITVSKAAVEAFLKIPHDQASSVSQSERCEFVRQHLGLVAKAAMAQLHTNPSASRIFIAAGELGTQGSPSILELPSG